MVTVSGPQCQSKINGLKKMYKKVLDHNNISGNDWKSWQYFEVYYLYIFFSNIHNVLLKFFSSTQTDIVCKFLIYFIFREWMIYLENQDGQIQKH